MNKLAKLAGAVIALAIAGSASSAWADFSACDGALRANDPEQQIKLYTLCINQGGLPIADRAGAYNDRGNAFHRLGEVDKALQDYTWAIESDPNWATSYVNRARLYLSRGAWAKASADYEKAIQVGPWIAHVGLEAYSGEAWLLATCRDAAVRDGPKAVKLAQKAVKYRDGPATRDTLAAAYAEAGQFEDAVREETKAIALAQSKTPSEDTAGFQARLELYRQRVPYRN